MLDDFYNNPFYNYAKNLKKFYHAYLFEVDDLESSYKIVLAFAKMIICSHHYTNLRDCQDCNICHLIDNNYFENLKIIEPDGINIKKEQIQELQKSLSLKSSNNLNQVYIIKDASKMNLSATNSLLKFIEEPEDGIYALLITKDRKQILPTILSRCILINLKTTKESYDSLKIQDLTNFLKLIMTKKAEALPYLKINFFDKFDSRDKVIEAFNLMEIILDCLLKINYQINCSLSQELCDIIKKTLGEFARGDIIFYLDKIVKFKNKLEVIPNLNLNLFMDKFLIEIGKVPVVYG